VCTVGWGPGVGWCARLPCHHTRTIPIPSGARGARSTEVCLPAHAHVRDAFRKGDVGSQGQHPETRGVIERARALVQHRPHAAYPPSAVARMDGVPRGLL